MLVLRRPVRNWLVLQSKSTYLILILADTDADQILQIIETRSHVKITR
jgi:hypothetical protein